MSIKVESYVGSFPRFLHFEKLWKSFFFAEEKTLKTQKEMENTISLPSNMWQFNRNLVNGYFLSSEERAVEAILARYKLYIPNYKYRQVEKLVDWLDKDFVSKQGRVEMLNFFYSIPSIVTTLFKKPNEVKNRINFLNNNIQSTFQFERLLYSKYRNELITFLKNNEHFISKDSIVKFVSDIKIKEDLSKKNTKTEISTSKKKEVKLTVFTRIFILWVNNQHASYFNRDTKEEICNNLSNILNSDPDYIQKQYNKFISIAVDKNATVKAWDGVKSNLNYARSLIVSQKDLEAFDNFYKPIENHYENLRK